MKVLQTQAAPRYRRSEGITSYLLASPRTAGAQHLTVTVVEIEPGGRQRVHSHLPEQVYFILQGRGRMTVDSETREVCPGDCVFIPGQARHGLENTTDTPLKYLSAAAPAFRTEELDAFWPLPSEVEESADPQENAP